MKAVPGPVKPPARPAEPRRGAVPAAAAHPWGKGGSSGSPAAPATGANCKRPINRGGGKAMNSSLAFKRGPRPRLPRRSGNGGARGRGVGRFSKLPRPLRLLPAGPFGGANRLLRLLPAGAGGVPSYRGARYARSCFASFLRGSAN